MKHILYIIIASFFIVSCSSNDEPSSETVNSYKSQIEELEKKIAEIEELNKDSEYTGIKIPVRVEPVKVTPFSHSFTAVGEVESIDEAFISPEINGQIINIPVKEGERVKKGQVLAQLSTIVIDKNLIEMEAQLELLETVYKKQSQLWDKGIGSELQYLEAKNNYENMQNVISTLKAQRSLATIKSPFGGIVEDIFQKAGELAAPGMQLMQVVNLDDLYINIQLSEAYLSVVKKGDVVDITFPSYPDIKLKEKIYRTGNVIKKQNRTFTVQIKIKNIDGKIKPNMLANVIINDYNVESAIVLPSIIIREDLNGSFVFILNNDVAEKKYVKTGRSFEDKTEVIEGLKPGDIVITEGYNNVSEGAVVKLIEKNSNLK